MPRFFFDLQEPGVVAKDHEGSELSDVDAAYREAAVSLGEIVRDNLRKSQEPHRIRMVVRDEAGTQICDMSIFFTASRPGDDRVRN